MPKPSRDHRIDTWRGLCLLDMLLIHMIETGMSVGHVAHVWLFDYLRFAAGGFIFIAGLGVGAIWLSKFRAEPLAITRRLWRRAGMILLVHYAMTLSFLLLVPMRGEQLEGFWTLLTDILLLRTGSDLLPFYCVMLLASPVLLWLLSRGRAVTLMAASIAIYAFGWNNPAWGNFPNQLAFRVPLWQLIFITGTVAGWLLPRYDALPERRKMQVHLASLGLAATTFILAFGERLGLPISTPLEFWKWPLSWAEALRYLTLSSAVFLTVDRLWAKLEARWLTGVVAQIGRRSLPVYVAHVWIVGLLLPFAARAGFPGALGLLWWILGGAMLWAVAEGVDRFTAWARTAQLANVRVSKLVTPGWLGGAVLAVYAAALLPVPLTLDDDSLATVEELESSNQVDADVNTDPLDDESLPQALNQPIDLTIA